MQSATRLFPLLLGLMIVLACLIALYAMLYLSGARTGFLQIKSDALWQSVWWRTAFYTHISGGAIALGIGGFQFVRRWRDRNLRRHRRAGVAYFMAVLCSGLAGLYLAVFATGGPVAQTGFALLALVWLTTGYIAYAAARRRDIEQHEKWVMRNYAATFAAVMLRLWMPFLIALIGLPFEDAYRIVAWLCWVPNLIVAEMLIQRR